MRRLLAVAMAWVLALSAVAAAHGRFDPGQYSSALRGKHVTVYFAAAGPNEVTEEYARQVLALAEEAYDELVTKGGLRPPRSTPVTVALQAGVESLGGSVTHADFGYDLWVQVNPRMSAEFALGDVVAHELFHAIQTAYQKGAGRPTWALEGTAPIAVAYAFGAKRESLESAMKRHLSLYWTAHQEGMKESTYLSSLFWYWMADRYGGLDFVRRVLQWSEDVPWERAAQLAAIEGGAPESTTFDRLWRSFVWAMVDGRMPKGYQTTTWFRPTRITWAGSAQELSRGDRVSSVTPLGHHYGYFKPLVLAPYSFALIEVDHRSGEPFDLHVTGDGALEAYVVRPGPALLDALRDGKGRPSYEQAAPPPSDPLTLGAPVRIGTPLRIDGGARDRTLVLVQRLGTWGHGQFAVELRLPRPEAKLPVWTSLSNLPHGGNTAGSPPPLTAAELAAVKAGTYLTGTSPLVALDLAEGGFKQVRVEVGSAVAWSGQGEAPLSVPATVDAAGNVWFPARAIARLLGATVEGSRFTFGERYVDAWPGVGRLETARGYAVPLLVPRLEGDELMVGYEFFSLAGCLITRTDNSYTFTYPHPDAD